MPDGPLWLVSLHLHWPFPYQQPDQVKWLLPILEALDDPVLIGGDFNMVPWSYTLKSVARATDTKLSGYAGGTFELSYVYQDNDLATWMPLLPIDHILVPASGPAVSLERRPQLGSDHYGLLGEFVLMTR
jgi:endonuclease/exonuclease/phosphatase (EEP) superfamily protein YafD